MEKIENKYITKPYNNNQIYKFTIKVNMINLAIFGATGVVGLEIISILDGGNILYDNLFLYSSNSSIGTKFNIQNKAYEIIEFNNTFLNIDFAIFAVSSELSKHYVKIRDHTNSNCIIIDNSCAFRMVKNIPLIIPEINMDSYKKQNIIANPNCSTIIMLMILAPLHKYNLIEQIDISTYQAASGAGLAGMKELEEQTKAFIENKSLEPHMNVFKKQYVFNAFSHNSDIDMESKFNEEEIKLILETKKILNDDNIIINPTCVRIPTLRSHMESITIRFQNDSSVEKIKKILMESSGVQIYDFPERNEFPEPIITEKKDDVYVGRIRQSYHKDPKTFQLLVSGDQIRKGAALNAIQIYNKLVSKDMLKIC
jgi:aspartate-semialdehyde dehydrogenase